MVWTLLESPWSEDHYHAPGLVGDIAPAMRDTLRQVMLAPADASKIFSPIAMR
jgi:hypothetical protein